MGQMSIAQRDNSLALFRENAECNVLLGSISAAGVGIDLQCAENVYIMVSVEEENEMGKRISDAMFIYAGAKLEPGHGGTSC